MKLKEEWEIIYQAEKANRAELEKDLKAAWQKDDSFALLLAWARLCAWDEAHPSFVRYEAISKVQKKEFAEEICQGK